VWIRLVMWVLEFTCEWLSLASLSLNYALVIYSKINRTVFLKIYARFLQLRVINIVVLLLQGWVAPDTRWKRSSLSRSDQGVQRGRTFCR